MNTTNQTTLFHSVVELNARGVLLMEQGENKQASSLFHEGLRTLLNGLQDELCPGASVTQNSRLANQHTEFADTILVDGKIQSCRVLRSVSLLQKGGRLVPGDNNVFVLFDRALHPSSDVGFLHPECYDHIMTGILLFNVALCNHLIALSRGGGESKCLSKALRFYSMSHDTLEELPPELSKLLELAFLAATNNIGHIHAHFLRLQEAGMCSLELSSRLMALTSTGQSGSISDEEKDVFYTNAFFFHEVKMLTAASAA